MSSIPEPIPVQEWDGAKFAVDPGGLHGVAGEVGRVFDDVNAAIDDWAYADALSTQELAIPDVSSAHSKFTKAWSAETNHGQLTLSDLVERLSTAAQRYEESEHYSAEQLSRPSS